MGVHSAVFINQCIFTNELFLHCTDVVFAAGLNMLALRSHLKEIANLAQYEIEKTLLVGLL
jgi:hypothetical protein